MCYNYIDSILNVYTGVKEVLGGGRLLSIICYLYSHSHINKIH